MRYQVRQFSDSGHRFVVLATFRFRYMAEDFVKDISKHFVGYRFEIYDEQE